MPVNVQITILKKVKTLETTFNTSTSAKNMNQVLRKTKCPLPLFYTHHYVKLKFSMKGTTNLGREIYPRQFWLVIGYRNIIVINDIACGKKRYCDDDNKLFEVFYL